jgi:hypothetical protein
MLQIQVQCSPAQTNVAVWAFLAMVDEEQLKSEKSVSCVAMYIDLNGTSRNCGGEEEEEEDDDKEEVEKGLR